MIWSAIRAFKTLRAALRGLRVHHHPRRESELGLSLRAVSDLGRGDSRGLERSERSLE